MSETAILLIKLLENSASGFVVITALAGYVAYKSGLLSRLLGNGKSVDQAEEFRRRGDREMSRLATAIEILNQILREVSETQKDMARLLDRQQHEVEGAVELQKDMRDVQDDMRRKVRQIHSAVINEAT